MIQLTIDGREISVPEGTMVVDAAAKLGIEVPVYCYHQSLGPLGACRICLVEIEKMPKLQTACTTAVREGMVVHTGGPAVEKGRKGILEFLLINHPLDCPVCDKGGECFLQDYTLWYGPGKNRFEEAKIQRQKDYPVSPYILLDQERCVLCQRCVRFLGEYVGEEQLMLDGRGVHTVVSTVDGRPASSPYAGNVIDLCPVGALLSEPYHFKARPWNIEREETVCSVCPVGCAASVTGRDGAVVRLEGRPEPARDDFGFLCDHGRFTYDFGRHPLRLRTAQLDGREVAVGDAIAEVGRRLKEVIDQHGPGSVGVLTGAVHTVEDEWAMRRFAEAALDTSRIAVVKPVAGDVPLELLGTFQDVAAATGVLLLGADPYEAAPVVHLKLRSARRQHGLSVWGLGDRPLTRTTLAGDDFVVDPGRVGERLGAVASEAEVDGEWKVLRQGLLDTERLVVLWDGADPAAAAAIVALAARRGAEKPTRVIPTHGPRNWLGAMSVGIPAHASAAAEILKDAAEGRLQALVLWGADPVRDYPDGDLAARALERVPAVYFAGWFPPRAHHTLSAMLPTAAWAEVTGAYANMEGRMEVAHAAAAPPGQARPGRSLLAALARAMQKPIRFGEEFDPFEGLDGDLIPRRAAEQAELPKAGPPAAADDGGFRLITGEVVAVAHPPSEIAARTTERHPVRLHPEDAERVGMEGATGTIEIRQGDRHFTVGARRDQRIPKGRVFVPRGLEDAPVNRLDSRVGVQVAAVRAAEEVSAR
jgi:NADH-quinone oxidoreductase subunit G